MTTFDMAYNLISQNAAKVDTSRLGGENVSIEMELVGEGGGVMSADLRGGVITVRRGAAARPDCVITMTTGDFERLINGTLSPMQALFSGRVRVQGDISVLNRLQDVLGF